MQVEQFGFSLLLEQRWCSQALVPDFLSWWYVLLFFFDFENAFDGKFVFACVFGPPKGGSSFPSNENEPSRNKYGSPTSKLEHVYYNYDLARMERSYATRCRQLQENGLERNHERWKEWDRDGKCNSNSSSPNQSNPSTTRCLLLRHSSRCILMRVRSNFVIFWGCFCFRIEILSRVISR